MRRSILCVVIVFLCACGGGGRSPVQPQPPSPSPQNTNWVLAGTVIDTLTGSAIPGAKLTFTTQPPATTSASGQWELRGTGRAAIRLAVTVEALGYVTRETGVAWASEGRRDIQIDLIPDRPPFALPFFRQFVRNGHEQPDALQPVRRWTRTPNFYLNTMNPRTGQPLLPSEIALIQQVIRDSVPKLTAGQFSAGTIEAAAEPRERRADFINVNIVHDPAGDYCGKAFVGANPGEITINYERCRSRTCGQFPPETIAHEVGHAMGYWHTSAEGSVMNPYATSRRCDNAQFSADELLHARVAYARPLSNRDPDIDPSTFAALETSAATEIVCRLR